MEKERTILVIEDDLAIGNALYDALHRQGFNVLLSYNGGAGLETALKEHPDLILLDIVMPKIDGVEVLKKLRADVWGKDAHVIVISNLSSDKEIAEAKEYSIHDYLIKTDWTLDSLVKKVNEVCAE